MLFACVAAVVLLCAAAPALTRFAGRNAGWILAAALLAVAGALLATTGFAPDSAVEQHVPWIPSLDIGLTLRLDALSLVFSMLVLVIGAGILAYSARYLSAAGTHGSFYTLMTTFAAAMLLLVLSNDIVVLFVAWEATTLCSFFLIARSGEHAREPAIRTLLVTAAGGLSLLGAVAVMVVGSGTTLISDILVSPMWTEQPGYATAAAVLLAGAAFTKSAQFPFQAWLPDSMVAITPVSGYLHAAAMVKAGIYLLLRFSPPLAGDTLWSTLLITAGLITALLGASAALKRYDLKELLAYSTISQLGLLVVMIGVGTPAALTAAVVHTVGHALFKSSLFMFVGVIDHEAGTRDIRKLRMMRLRMPVTAIAMTLAAASMAGVPLLLGFISKEMMFESFLDAGTGWVVPVVVIGAAITSALTFAYSGRLILGAFSGRGERTITEAPTSFWIVPALAAVAGLGLGIVPFILDPLVDAAATAVIGQPAHAHLALWHGFTPALGVSALVIASGVLLIVFRNRVEKATENISIPISGLAVVDGTRFGIIRVGGVVGTWTGTRSPRLHLALPVVSLVVIAALGYIFVGELPAVIGDASRPMDWLLLALVAAGVLALLRVRTRISAVVVTGVIGFAMTLWYFTLGAADVAMTQLLVEILTVCVMVLMLRRLPAKIERQTWRKRVPAALLAVAAGVATTVAVWALTGRREMSDAAEYYLTEGYVTTGGPNIVNTILVDFRAFDTLGELTVLGIAGVAMAALLHSRHLTGTRSARIDTSSPLANAEKNAVFVGTITRILGPIIIVLSIVLLLRGHYEPGGGFISALVGGAGFALVYLAAPSDSAARVRWPYMALIGAGIVVGTGTGFLGYLEGSFLTPIDFDIFGYGLSSALIFDLGVYLGVIGIVLATFNLLGRRHRVSHDDDPEAPTGPVPVTESATTTGGSGR
ncbi:DUF4040 family protein [Microbacterium amylolyticum]|uniref:Multicomponent Na+:H+ antiporter subunit A n=1 Tax=Microbacterium amylolyticum TaxID=936337 RepID=A0ABS4ZK80_9MICO|nr:DUF4040 family protein [Microbacterium amylolyticum]MBP2437697.1 multicomponent Na+:H+ antiporter subunit A [Microbacterium amylolyticum]